MPITERANRFESIQQKGSEFAKKPNESIDDFKRTIEQKNKMPQHAEFKEIFENLSSINRIDLAKETIKKIAKANDNESLDLMDMTILKHEETIENILQSSEGSDNLGKGRFFVQEIRVPVRKWGKDTGETVPSGEYLVVAVLDNAYNPKNARGTGIPVNPDAETTVITTIVKGKPSNLDLADLSDTNPGLLEVTTLDAFNQVRNEEYRKTHEGYNYPWSRGPVTSLWRGEATVADIHKEFKSCRGERLEQYWKNYDADLLKKGRLENRSAEKEKEELLHRIKGDYEALLERVEAERTRLLAEDERKTQKLLEDARKVIKDEPDLHQLIVATNDRAYVKEYLTAIGKDVKLSDSVLALLETSRVVTIPLTEFRNLETLISTSDEVNESTILALRKSLADKYPGKEKEIDKKINSLYEEKYTNNIEYTRMAITFNKLLETSSIDLDEDTLIERLGTLNAILITLKSRFPHSAKIKLIEERIRELSEIKQVNQPSSAKKSAKK